MASNLKKHLVNEEGVGIGANHVLKIFICCLDYMKSILFITKIHILKNYENKMIHRFC